MKITVQRTTFIKGMHLVVLQNWEKKRGEDGLSVCYSNVEQQAVPAHRRPPWPSRRFLVRGHVAGRVAISSSFCRIGRSHFHPLKRPAAGQLFFLFFFLATGRLQCTGRIRHRQAAST